MEEAVRTSRDSLVTIDTSRAKHTYWRFVSRHIMSLIVRCVTTKKHILRNVHRIATLNEESVLHITSRMISSEVKHGKDVLIVVYLRTLV